MWGGGGMGGCVHVWRDGVRGVYMCGVGGRAEETGGVS